MSLEVVLQSMSVVPFARAARMSSRCATDLEATAATVPESGWGSIVTSMLFSLGP